MLVLELELECIDLTTWPAPPMDLAPHVSNRGTGVGIHHRPCKLGFLLQLNAGTKNAFAAVPSRDPFPDLSMALPVGDARFAYHSSRLKRGSKNRLKKVLSIHASY